MRDDVVTCGLDDLIADVRARMDESPYRFALVTSSGGVLLGRLRSDALEGDPAARAEDVMEPGPTTVRPDTRPDELAARLAAKDLTMAIVSTPQGHPLGVVLRRDLEEGSYT